MITELPWTKALGLDITGTSELKSKLCAVQMSHRSYKTIFPPVQLKRILSLGGSRRLFQPYSSLYMKRRVGLPKLVESADHRTVHPQIGGGLQGTRILVCCFESFDLLSAVAKIKDTEVERSTGPRVPWRTNCILSRTLFPRGISQMLSPNVQIVFCSSQRGFVLYIART